MEVNEIDAQRQKQEQSEAAMIAAQTKAAQQQMQAELQRMMTEVKQKLKPLSKNELIRTINALLLDNYTPKMLLAEAQSAQSVDKVAQGDKSE